MISSPSMITSWDVLVRSSIAFKMTDDEPFKEPFRHIPPPLLQEVRTHVNDMLQAGAIQPSSSPWCNAVILILKKDSGLHFCTDFRKLNVRTKKDSYPLLTSRKPWRAWRGPIYSSVLTSNGVSGRWRWTRHLSSTLPLQ